MFINRHSLVAAADIGCGQAVVFEYSADVQIDEGDRLEQLASGYRKLTCVNTTKQLQVNVTVLAEALPLKTAGFVVTATDSQLSQVA